MLNGWFFGMVAAALVDWIAVIRCRNDIRLVSKPLVLILLIAWYTSRGGWQGAGAIFGAAFIFALLGDIFLLKKLVRIKRAFFQAGLFAFLVMQVLYVIGFNRPGTAIYVASLILIAGVIAAAVISGRRIFGALRQTAQGRAQTIPVIIYMLAISLMFVSALSLLLRPDWAIRPALLVAVGAALFFISDNVLAHIEFVRRIRWGEEMVITTYHIGQMLIAGGLLLHMA